MIQQSGSVISYQQLQRAFGYSSINTVRNHLAYLQESYLLYEVSAYSYKLKERSTLPKKNYACDIGMMNSLSTKATDDFGMKLETLVFLHLRRKTKNIFYLKSSQYDIDFAVTEDRKISSLIQVCFNISDERTRKRELSSLLNAAKKWKVTNLKIITWSNSEELHLEGVEIQVIPAWKFCLS
jgi:hypothetical protein